FSIACLIFGCACHALWYLFFIVLVAFLGYSLYIKHIHMKYDHIPGPPRNSFFFGHTPTFLREMKAVIVCISCYLYRAQTYGPVYRLNGLHHAMIVVSCPEATKEILMSPKYPKDKFAYKRLFHLFGQRFLGNGMVTAVNHEQWYKQRRIMDPAFSSLYLRGLMSTFNERAERLMDKLADFADCKKETCMLHLVNCVTLDVIAKVAFGVDLDLLKHTDSPFPKAIEVCLEGMMYHVRDAFFQLIPKNWPFVNEVRQACKLLRDTGYRWIQARKTAIQHGEEVPKDILTQIIKSADKEESMGKDDEEFMLDNFVTFFIAGQETTANQLKPTAVNEIVQLPHNPPLPSIYLQVLKETLRLYPTAPGTSREVHEDMVINGIHIPGGVTCFSSYVTSRMDKFFKDPLTFDPDRFHPDAPKPYYCYYPFSLGPRSCLGQNFAQMEAKVVMAKLLQRFEFNLVPGQSFDIRDVGTLRPKDGVMSHIKHRNHSKVNE
uniref:Cholesterol 24-hydroxylase-like n=1 Tax=Myripristis murdjan TaxID=586833 RepID=A0A667Y9Z0_9TELE